MAEQKVSTRYASSLLESAIQEDQLDTVSNDIEFISSTLKQNPNLNRMLVNPVVRPEIKHSILEEIFKNKINSETMDFILFVVKKKREDILSNILEKFKELRDLKTGFVNVNVAIASEFTDSQKNELQNKLQSILMKKVRMSYHVDEKILGGFIVQAGDTVYNASIKHQLDLLKKRFSEVSPVKN
jgi:F-type H+-transporting ATPase subunit delta